MSTSSTSLSTANNLPAAVAAAGYNTETFSPNIIVGQNWIADTQNGTTANTTQNSDGSVTISGGGDTWNGQLETYVGGQGEAFGGGFYAQATVSVPGATAGLSPWTGGTSGNQWPSWWANSTNGSVETDFMELMSATPGENDVTVHNWTTSPATGYGQAVYAPAGNTLHGPDTYGFLWIPATATTQGSMTFFLDGQAVGNPITWTQSNPGMYGIIDGQQMVLRLGAGPNSPATFSNIQVWQASTAGDSINGQPAPYIAPATGGGSGSGNSGGGAATPSANNAFVLAGSTAAITDASGNQWTITTGGQVAVNGVADTTTSAVIKLAYESGLIWQENSSHLWWSKTSSSAAWTGGTATSPMPPAPPLSADNTVVMASSTAAITDASGNQWTITAGGQVAVNGITDTTTSSVVELAYEKGLIWQENASNLWWSKTSPGAAWTGGTATSPLPPPPPPSANNTVVMAGSTAAITDAAGNKWTITTGGQVAVNGVADTTTARVTELAYEKGLIWQENSSNLWWSKTSPTAAWTGGTATSPVPVVVVPSLNDTVVMAGSTAAITDAAGNKWSITAGGQVAVNGVADTTTNSVVKLDYTKGLVWQENTSSLWWSKASASAAWGPGTATPPISIAVTNATTAAVMTIDATKAQSTTDYGATFSLTAPGAAKVTLGATPVKLAFVAMASVTLTAGTAAATVVADGGSNTFTAGKSTLDVKGGAGADHYVYHSGNALLTVEDFAAAKGDTLTIDTALKGSLVSASDGHGGTMMSFGSMGAGADLKGVATMPTTSIHWA